jgi:hypothetical protein
VISTTKIEGFNLVAAGVCLVALAGCMSDTTATGQKPAAATSAKSGRIAVSNCFVPPESETERAKQILASRNVSSEEVFWFSPDVSNQLISVAASSGIELPNSCITKMNNACENIGASRGGSFVFTRRAAEAPGEIAVMCGKKG